MGKDAAASEVHVHPYGKAMEDVHLQGLHMSLVASGDGTELIRHRLAAGSEWAIGPMTDWAAMEYVCLTSGKLLWRSARGDVTLAPGDVISALSIRQEEVFYALEDTEFLYFCSQPVFYLFSDQVRELNRLAVAIEEKDGYTSDHCERIKRLAMDVGREMRLSAGDLCDLNLGAFFHDVGKSRVPLSILCKPDKLTPAEWVEMKRHATHGKQLLEETHLPIVSVAAQIVEQHHERYNGSGYPHGLGGKQMLIQSSIVAVVDSFDAMTTDRPYHKAASVDEAFSEISSLKEQLYHPDVVEVFLSLADKLHL